MLEKREAAAERIRSGQKEATQLRALRHSLSMQLSARRAAESKLMRNIRPLSLKQRTEAARALLTRSVAHPIMR